MKTRRQQTMQDEQRAWQRLKRKHKAKVLRRLVHEQHLARLADRRRLHARSRVR